MRFAAPAAFGVLALLLLAGCAGGKDDPTTAVTVTKKETVTQTTSVAPTTTSASPTTTPTTTAATTSATSTTTTSSTVPGVRPQVDNVTLEGVDQTSARVRWEINGSGDARSRVEYGIGSAFNQQTSLANGTGAQTKLLTGLASCTAYQVRIKATGGGFEVISPSASFTTLGMPPSTTAPTVGTTMHSSLAVAWTVTGADDVTSFVEYGTTTAYGTASATQTGTGGKTATLPNLSQNTEYHVRVRVSSACGNTQSADVVFRTALLVPIDIFGNSGAASFGPGGAATPGPITISGVPAAGRDMVFVIKNKDSMTHTFSIDGKAYTSDPISAGATYTMPTSIKLTPGGYTIRCTLHTNPAMTGTLQVTG